MTTNLTAVISGLWTPGTVPALTQGTYLSAQASADEATRVALDLDDGFLGFYLVATATPGGPVYRSRWKIAAEASGPTLRTGTTEAHEAQVWLTLRVYPRSEVQQVTYDQDHYDDMPFQGILAPVVAALLLRKRFGAAEREITVGSFGTGTFMPVELGFDGLYPPTPSTADYGADGLAGYGTTLPAGTASHPTVWLSADGDAWKVSYCVDQPSKTYEDRWDDPDEALPVFDPLPEPQPVIP